jgi:formate transporter
LLAVVCTWFLQTAMCMYFKARSDVARMAFAFYGPFAFVIGGTQHVIANVGFLGLPLLLNLFHPAAPRGGISWGFGDDGLLTNICITTVGNLVGGTLFVALPFWAIARLQRQQI